MCTACPAGTFATTTGSEACTAEVPLVINNHKASRFAGSCSINGAPTPAAVTVDSITTSVGTAEILTTDNTHYEVLFEGLARGKDTFTIALGSTSAVTLIPTSGTFTGSFNSATSAFPTLAINLSSPPVTVTINGTTITGVTFGPLQAPPIVNTVTFSTAPPFPQAGSSVFFDLTLIRSLTLQFQGGTSCTLAGQTGNDITTNMARSVAIDIKPGSFPNSINPRNNGKIPVAILTTPTFDATTVAPATVRFGQTGTEAAPVQSALEDVDRDGDLDMILHFNTQQTKIGCGDTSAALTGKTRSGQGIAGEDSIKTAGCQ